MSEKLVEIQPEGENQLMEMGGALSLAEPIFAKNSQKMAPISPKLPKNG